MRDGPSQAPGLAPNSAGGASLHPTLANGAPMPAAGAAPAPAGAQQAPPPAADSPSSSGDVSAADTLLVSIPGTMPGDSDVRVSVVCNGLMGVLLLPKKRVIVNPGTEGAREVSPTEFERLAGKGGAKKWRQTIHLRNGGREGAARGARGAGGGRRAR